jgi:predicted acetyltransferase
MEIRTCKNIEELRDATNALTHYFGRERPTEDWAERWGKNFEINRMHAALDDGGIVGGAGAFTFRMTVPGGGSLPCAGVTVVAVLPTHRRRGVLRSMMRAQLDDVHERGEPIAALWASEETIYGRFGYGLASLNLKFDIGKGTNDFRPGVMTAGTIRMVDADEAATLFPPVYEAVRRVTPGMYERSESWWRERLLIDLPEFRFGGGPKVQVVVEADREPQAYAIYRLHVAFGDLGPETTLRTLEVMSATPEATATIWRYLLDVDWTKTVSAGLQPVDHPLLLLLARPNLARPTLSDGLWVRLVDVGVALSGRSYAADGAVVLDVHDDFCPWNEGRWRVESGEASRTTDAADLALDVADLGSVYLGGFTFRDLHRAGRVEELRGGAVYGADAIFRTEAAPWCPEIF